MARYLTPYLLSDLKKLTRRRAGEKKLGEVISAADDNWRMALKNNAARYVIVGIAEDIGVRANLGRPGAHSAFRPALSSFLNQQHNSFFPAERVMVLGEIYTADLMKKAEKLSHRSKADLAVLRSLVSELDARVVKVITAIVQAGKIPVVIGGGHNNAFGNITGSAKGLKKKINVINCDPHLDFRALEGRHSGNGFSYAFEAGHIERYAVLCMHEQYNNENVLGKFAELPGRCFFETFEAVFIREEKAFSEALLNCIGFVKERSCGVEIDLDAISNVPSSARTSSGISPTEARQYVHACASRLNCAYLHIAEAAPVLSHIRADIKTGKLITYLITDFIKAMETKAQCSLL